MGGNLARFEVPRAAVDLQTDTLTGKQKSTVLKYLALEDTLAGLGRHRFNPSLIEHIPLKPVRDWVNQHWDQDFSYDFSQRIIPITFRTALALGLFSTVIADHLERMGRVEVWGSREVQEIFSKHDLPKPDALAKVDYSSLQGEVKRELVGSLIDQMEQAQMVATAHLLFPAGVDIQIVMRLDPSFALRMFGSPNTKRVNFNGINDLDFQSAAARGVVANFNAVKALEGVVSEVREKEEVLSDGQRRERDKRWEEEETRERPPDIHFDPGTKFVDVFPYGEGETSEDVLRAYKRLTGDKAYQGETEDHHIGEYLDVHINPDGRLIGVYGFDWGGEAYQKELDMLADRLNSESTEDSRRTTILNLVADLRNELDSHNQALQKGQSTYGQTSFTVEKGFLDALTGIFQEGATDEQIMEDKHLAVEANKTAGLFVNSDVVLDDSKSLALYSGRPIDREALDLDYAILRSIQKQPHLDLSDIAALIGGSIVERDKLGEWFDSCRSLLTKFRSVLVGSPDLFDILNLSPTNEESMITAAYRSIVKDTHPDRIGELPAEEQADAIVRFMRATNAYRELLARLKNQDPSQLSPSYYLGRISKLFEN